MVVSSMQPARHIAVLGTGGTIAGVASDPSQPWRYDAAQLSVEQLLASVPALAGVPMLYEQVAQVDSKDMNWSVWRKLALALRRLLARDDIGGVVITHGTDTLEETAYLLHCLHDGVKPIVLTAAMRPATAPDADGPGNLLDAVRVAQWASEQGVGGVVAVMAGRVWAGVDVRKVHSHALDAFDGGGQSILASIDHLSRSVLPVRAWPQSGKLGWDLVDIERPPRVELVTSHADADGALVDALCAHVPDLAGLIVACTGHGTVNEPLQRALEQAQRAGVTVWRSSRVARGGVQAREGDAFAAVADLTAAQARVALVLHELGARL